MMKSRRDTAKALALFLLGINDLLFIALTRLSAVNAGPF
jgi:hypothetical protein